MKREDIEKLIIIYDRRLQKLKEQQALAGISVDPKILIEIEDIEAKIAELQTELSQEMQKIEPTPQIDATKGEGLYGKSQKSFLMKCSACGLENRPYARFCQRCGQPLPAKPASLSPSYDQSAASPAATRPEVPPMPPAFPKMEPAIKAESGGQVAIDGGLNIQIDAVYGGQLNISPTEYDSQVPTVPAPLTGQSSDLPKPSAEKKSQPFKLQLIRRGDLDFEVRALHTPMGEPHAMSRLPYTIEELIAVQKAVRAAERFTAEQLDILKQLGLLINSHFVPDLHERIGQQLYNALMPKDIGEAFQMALSQARLSKGTVALQLRFDEDAVELAQYPWELLYFRRALLPSRAVELTRYLSYPEAVTTLAVTPPLRLLFIQPRPIDLPALPGNSEQTTVRQALGTLEAEKTLKVDTLSRPMYEALLDYLETEAIHILHFDGHGVFARRCPTCQAMNYPQVIHCQAEHGDAVCGQDITYVKPQGYLAFEDENGGTRWVRSETLGHLLFNRPVRLAVLSACRSGSVGGETLFGGTAPALIQAGVPAVVSTQLPISVEVVVKFIRGFYRALARFESVPAAVNAGRLHVFDTGEWFIPTLYLRSQDEAGYLFQKKEA